ncbi:MAG: ATP-binding protein [Spirochaetaceae bacterium]|nr:ATP-binding protein [Spirochaetaceae bacterium]
MESRPGKRFKSLGLKGKLLALCILLATLPVLVAGGFVVSYLAKEAEAQARAQLTDKLTRTELLLQTRRSEVERAARTLATENLITINLDLGLDRPVGEYLAERKASLLLDFLGVLRADGEVWIAGSDAEAIARIGPKLSLGRPVGAGTGGSFAFYADFDQDHHGLDTDDARGASLFAGYAVPIASGQGEVIGFLVAGDRISEGSRLWNNLESQVQAPLDILPGDVIARHRFVNREIEGQSWLFQYSTLDPGDAGIEGEAGWPAGAFGIGFRRSDYLAVRDRTIRGFVAIFIGATLGSAVLGVIFSRSITRRVDALVEGTKRIARGDFLEPIPAGSPDELGVLADSFNDMYAKLAASLSALRKEIQGRRGAEIEIQRLNEGLERRIAERTSELEAANEELETTIGRLEATRDQLVESAKMASLGQLVASIAHEINTPLGAIASANEGTGEELRRILTSLPSLSDSLSPEDRRAFSALFAAALEPREIWTPTEIARADRKSLEARLGSAGSTAAAAIADDLVEIGIGGLDDSLVAALLGARGAEMLELTLNVSWLLRSSEIIAAASEKAAKTIVALKTYSHLEPADVETDVDIASEMETILSLYFVAHRHEVELTKRFFKAPTIRGRKDNLNQVWVNLVNNALQAMEYKGRLEIVVESSGDGVLVTVADSGPGIPEELRSRIFDAFFTTKRPGEGSGLGLSICKEIVEAHSGTIAFECAEGRTAFMVYLPCGGGGRPNGGASDLDGR